MIRIMKTFRSMRAERLACISPCLFAEEISTPLAAVSGLDVDHGEKPFTVKLMIGTLLEPPQVYNSAHYALAPDHRRGSAPRCVQEPSGCP